MRLASRVWSWSTSVLALAVGISAAPQLAAADDTVAAEPAPRRPRYHAVDLQGVVTTQLLPHTFFGGEAAYVIGTEGFQARFGAKVSGGRPFALLHGKIANTVAVGELDLCGAKTVLRHRVRMCVGGEAGVMAHRWIGWDRPGRSATPYVAGSLKGDYRYAVSDNLGVLFGVGASVPVIGPQFVGDNTAGLPTIVFPGPVTGMVTLGVSFRLR